MTEPTYNDDDLVYIDPDQKKIIGLVEWKNDKVVPKERIDNQPPPEEGASNDKKRSRRPRKKQYYPWGTYRSMKRLYKIEGKGKDKDNETYIPLNKAIDKLQEEPYWD